SFAAKPRSDRGISGFLAMSLPDSDDFVPGSLLGRYELLLPIAKGGMGRVWAARLRGSGGFQKLVAVKTILKSCDDGRFDQMLLGEATLASLIRHPNVAQCLDRKSTRLNSSHVKISYAVFCLKKKNNNSYT